MVFLFKLFKSLSCTRSSPDRAGERPRKVDDTDSNK